MLRQLVVKFHVKMDRFESNLFQIRYFRVMIKLCFLLDLCLQESPPLPAIPTNSADERL